MLTKVLQRPRLAAYLEQSTRYIAYDAPMPDPPGGYRYYRDPELGPRLPSAMDELFEIYAGGVAAGDRMGGGRSIRAPWHEPAAAHARAIKAKALDLLRGLLPASSLSHMGIYASGQSYEQLILHLLAHPLPEARDVRDDDPRGGTGRDPELRHARAAPRSRRRVDRAICSGRDDAVTRWAQATRSRDGLHDAPGDGPSVTLLAVQGDEDDLLAALLFESASASEESDQQRVQSLTEDERAQPARRARRRSLTTAATVPGGGSKLFATGLRSSPTMARSETSSATGC